VNTSDAQFTVAGGQILFGLAGIKGVGQGAVEAIIEARKEKPFEDLFDFCQRAGSGKVNKRVIESLIKCGALDNCGGAPREKLLAALEDALLVGQRSRQKKQANSASLFETVAPPPKKERDWPAADELTEPERLSFEKELLGFYVSGHPLDKYLSAMAAIRTCPLSEAKSLKDKSKATLCGTLSKFQQRMGKNDNPYAFATIEDVSGSVELIIWSNVLNRCSQALEAGRLVTVQGVVDNKGADEKFGLKVIASDVKEFEKSLDQGFGSITINASLGDLDGLIDYLASKTRLRGLKKISAKSSSWKAADPSLVTVYLTIADGLGKAVYCLEDKVRLSNDLFQELGRRLPLSRGEAVSCSASLNPFSNL
jgi:DNA polymerase III alpha subunit